MNWTVNYIRVHTKRAVKSIRKEYFLLARGPVCAKLFFTRTLNIGNAVIEYAITNQMSLLYKLFYKQKRTPSIGQNSFRNVNYICFVQPPEQPDCSVIISLSITASTIIAPTMNAPTIIALTIVFSLICEITVLILRFVKSVSAKWHF